MIIGLGIDLQLIQKMEKAIARGKGRFLQRTFTPAEIRYCRGRKNPAQHFSARFCAKEAFFKALGTGWAKGLRWPEAAVARERSGRPALKLSGSARRMAARLGVKHIWLSLSHSGDYAAATVVLEG